MIRAEMDRPHTPDGDPGAQAALCEGMRPAGAESHRAHINARTRFFDGQVLDALDRGVRQIVILGAGYDDRALRFRSPGVHFVEIDHPDTQDDKRRRIEKTGADTTGLTLAPADFRHDRVGDVLAANGHDPDEPTLFICEGLLVYLDQPATVDLLGGLRSRANQASALAASLSIHPDGADPDLVLIRANAARRNSVNEPWRTILTVAGQRGLLARAGWSIDERYDDAQLDGAARTGRSLLAVATPGPYEDGARR